MTNSLIWIYPQNNTFEIAALSALASALDLGKDKVRNSRLEGVSFYP